MTNGRFITIGRAEDNDIKLSHTSVSRYHIKIFVDAEKNVFVTDLDSTNGTYVNGNRITGTVLLQREDILKVGFDKPIRWMRLIEGELPSHDTGSGIKDFAQKKMGGTHDGKTKASPIAKTQKIILAAAVLLGIVLTLFLVVNHFKNETNDTGENTVKQEQTKEQTPENSKISVPESQGIATEMPKEAQGIPIEMPKEKATARLAEGNYSCDTYEAVVSKINNKYVFTFITDWGARIKYQETYFNPELDILVVYNTGNDDQLKINVNAQSFRVWDGSYNWGIDYPYIWKKWYQKL
jgi:hypothetical protein